MSAVETSALTAEQRQRAEALVEARRALGPRLGLAAASTLDLYALTAFILDGGDLPGAESAEASYPGTVPLLVYIDEPPAEVEVVVSVDGVRWKRRSGGLWEGGEPLALAVWDTLRRQHGPLMPEEVARGES